MDREKYSGENSHKPFIIWTFRRTGGTNLGHALFKRSTFSGVQHEPFNSDRIFGSIQKNWNENEDEKELRSALTEICSQKVLMKHCLEIIPHPLNRALAEISTQIGYRHLFLYRRGALGRLLSLHFAKYSGVWGKEQVTKEKIDEEIFKVPLSVDKLEQHELHCRKEMREVYAFLIQLGAKPISLAFEDLYINNDVIVAKNQIRTLLSVFGLSKGATEDNAFLEQVLARGAQGTRDKYRKFTGYDDLASALKKIGDFTPSPIPLFKISCLSEQQEPGIVKCELWNPLPDIQADRFVLSGVVVPASDAQEMRRLLVEDAEGFKTVRWGLPSPRMAAVFPDNSKATHSRFHVAGVKVNADRPARLLVEYANGRQAVLATMQPNDTSAKKDSLDDDSEAAA